MTKKFTFLKYLYAFEAWLLNRLGLSTACLVGYLLGIAFGSLIATAILLTNSENNALSLPF